MLTIAKINGASVDYYESTVDRDEVSAGFDAVDYYGERGDATPEAFVLGGGELEALTTFGVQDGERVEESTVRDWLAEGVSPVTGEPLGKKTSSRTVTQKTKDGQEIRQRLEPVSGFDLTFAAPKSVSVVYALGCEEQRDAVDAAHAAAVRAGLEYMQTHAGYTRRHNQETGQKDLERTATFAGVSYEHRASRARDPHVHTHALLSNKQVRRDGAVTSLDGASIYHESRAGGMIYQATLRAELARSLGVEWEPVNERTGMADLKGFDRDQLRAWSQRTSELKEWAEAHDMSEATAAQLDAARRDTRAAKQHEGKSREEVRAEWQRDLRAKGIDLSAGGGIIGRVQQAEVSEPVVYPTPETVLAHVAQTKSAFTRADVVESVATLWPANGAPTPREEIEATAALTLAAALPLAERDRLPHEREGSVRYSSPEVIEQEARLMVSATARDKSLAVNELATVMGVESLSEDQAAAVMGIASSDTRVSTLIAPAGAGKTYSLSQLRAVYDGAGRTVVGLAPSGRAAAQLRADGVAEDAGTVASWMVEAEQDRCGWNERTVVVVDEAGMLGTAHMARLVEVAEERGAKVIAVGDPRQLAAVQQRGGALELLAGIESGDVHELSEVWRQRDETERSVGLLVRDGGDEEIATAAEWYDSQGRLHAGDQPTMMTDAYRAWQADRAAGHDSLFLASSWEYADAANVAAQRDAGTLADEKARRVQLGHEQHAGVGDVIMTRRNDYRIRAFVTGEDGRPMEAGAVMNSDRWRVEQITEDSRVQARRLGDGATTTLPGEYMAEHAHLGYAGTVHAAQGATADRVHTILDADSAQRSTLYVGATRGRDENHVYLAQRGDGDTEHEWTTKSDQAREGQEMRLDGEERRELFRSVAARDDRQITAHQAMREAREAEEQRLREEQERQAHTRRQQAREAEKQTGQRDRSSEKAGPEQRTQTVPETQAERTSEQSKAAKARELAARNTRRAQAAKAAQAERSSGTEMGR